MHRVTLQAWLSHADFPPEQVPDRYSEHPISSYVKAHETVFEWIIELPFAPYPGLVLWLGDVSTAVHDEAVIEKVFYDIAKKGFVCEVRTAATSSASFEDVVKAYIRAGWQWK